MTFLGGSSTLKQITYPTPAVSLGWAARRWAKRALPWLARKAVSAFWSIPKSSGASTVGRFSTYSQQTDNEISGGGGRYTCHVYKMILCEWQLKPDLSSRKKPSGNIIWTGLLAVSRVSYINCLGWMSIFHCIHRLELQTTQQQSQNRRYLKLIQKYWATLNLSQFRKKMLHVTIRLTFKI